MKDKGHTPSVKIHNTKIRGQYKFTYLPQSHFQFSSSSSLDTVFLRENILGPGIEKQIRESGTIERVTPVR